MKTKINYLDDSGAVVAEMNELRDESKDGAVLMAQKYLKQFPDLTAHVLCGETVTVVRQATEWQKRNG